MQHRAGSAQLQLWGVKGSACGAAHWTVLAGNGFRRTAARDPSKLPSFPVEQNAAYRAAEPADDARFIAVFAHALEHAGGYTPEEAKRAAGTLLPDIMHYDPTRPASFPNNGRALIDDVVAVFMPILTNGKVKGDKTGPHSDLLDVFPYVGSPHKARPVELVAA